MNLIDESFEEKKVDNSKKTTKIILIIMAVLVVAIIGIFIAIVCIENATLKLYIDGVQNEKVLQMMETEENGTIYFPIKDVATYLGYQSFNGEYTAKSEDASKCYVQNENEVANFALNSNKIYKLDISENDNENYNYFYSDMPVKAINGKLYATTATIEKAFNISFTYDTDKNRIYIYTMPYLIETYQSRVLNYGYEEISDKLEDSKTIFENMLIVKKDNGKTYAVIDTQGNTVIEAKYDKIEYLPYSGDFLVTSNNKVGIISAKKETKVQLIYDSLEQVDSESGLYIAKRDNKYGMIDSKGNIKIYIEYNQIGIDLSKFEDNDIKNKYLLDNGMIPVKKDQLWGAFDKNGNKVLDIEYDSFGYVASSNKDAINLLLIPEYNVMIACKNKKYTLISTTGEELCLPVIDDVYMTIESGKKYYKMNVGDTIGADVIEDFLDKVLVKSSSKQSSSNSSNSSSSKNTVDTQNTSVDDDDDDYIEVETE